MSAQNVVEAGTAIAQRMLDELGYFVLAFYPGPEPVPKVGEVRRTLVSIKGGMGEIPGPFVCVGYATLDEYMELFDRFAAGFAKRESVLRAATRAEALLKYAAE